MMEHDHAAEWMGEVRRGKALGELVAAAQVTDTEGEPVDLSRLQSDGTLAEDDELDLDAASLDDESVDEDRPAGEVPGEPVVDEEPDADELAEDADEPAEDADEPAEDADEKPATRRKTRSQD